MDRADYAEPILRARAALQTAERLLMDGRPTEAHKYANHLRSLAGALEVVCEAMAREQQERQS